MRKKNSKGYVQGSLFEEGYLIRTLGTIAHSSEIALTELVANTWDAGATKVNVFIPEEPGQKLIIEDNGIGLTKDQFYNRWMKLGYDRVKHQGKKVVFPPGIEGNRFAYGRNGIGRHGLLCFNNEYKVITCSKGEKSTFIITTLSEHQPFVIKKEEFGKSSQYGTRLEVTVAKNLPNPDRILDIISAKFLHDPSFIVSINRKTVPLEEHIGLINSKEIKVGEITLQANFIDSQKSGRSTIYQGIAFWQTVRLVGEPSWILGNEFLLDGRTRYAKRYTVVVRTDDLADYIFEDWSGFKKDPVMTQVYNEIGQYVNDIFSIIAKENIEETKQQIRTDYSHDYTRLLPLAKYHVDEAIEIITQEHPTSRPETLSLAVETIIKLERTKSGTELLMKLSQFSEDDITGLNELLDKWTIKEALTALDEIDNRIRVIEAIKKLSNDSNIDELHILHPLVTEARWIFGPEFESAEYSSNQQLHNAIENIFKKKIQKNVFNNHKKRPDIVVLANSTLSVTGTEAFDNDTGLSNIDKVLIIEIKRGGSKLSRKERDQAVGYVEDFAVCGNLIGSPYIEAFVVGMEFSEKVHPISTVQNEKKVELGKVRICLYSQLIDTAKRRLFGLREKLNSRYEDIPGMELYLKNEQQNKPEQQMKLDIL